MNQANPHKAGAMENKLWGYGIILFITQNSDNSGLSQQKGQTRLFSLLETETESQTTPLPSPVFCLCLNGPWLPTFLPSLPPSMRQGLMCLKLGCGFVTFNS